MMLSVLQPWEPALLMGSGSGLMRRPSFCRRRHRMSPDLPFRHSHIMSWDPCSQWMDVRRARRPTLNDLFEHIADSEPMLDLQDALNSVVENCGEFEKTGCSRGSPCRAVCNSDNILGNGLLKPLKWQRNDTTNEARAELQLPGGLQNLDDLNVELDEASRIITLKARRVDGPDNCRISRWEYSQRLDDSIDLNKLQASIDVRRGRLQIKAPLQAIDSPKKATDSTVEQKPQNIHRTDDVNSEEEQPPQPDAETASKDEEDTAEPQNQATTSGADRERAIEIEDVGADEDSDQISLPIARDRVSRQNSN